MSLGDFLRVINKEGSELLVDCPKPWEPSDSLQKIGIRLKATYAGSHGWDEKHSIGHILHRGTGMSQRAGPICGVNDESDRRGDFCNAPEVVDDV
ncbi:MAG: hypothetical protein Q9213_002112 [Squamulea squamosa]